MNLIVEEEEIINEEDVLNRGDGYKIVAGDNGKKYIVFINSSNKNFTIAFNYRDYLKFGLKGFNFKTVNKNGALTLDNTKFVHGTNGQNYIVLKNLQNPKYTAAINVIDFGKTNYSLSGFKFKDGIRETIEQSTSRKIFGY